MSVKLLSRAYDFAMEGEPGAAGGGAPAAAPTSILTGTPAPVAPATGNPPPPAAATTPPAAAPTESGWMSGLPKDLQDNPALKKFTSAEALAGAYVNAEKLIGAKGIPKPTAASTDADWRNVYKELGLPDSVDKYEVKMPEGTTVDKDFVSDFKDKAFQAGILPKQAQALADWFTNKNQTAEADMKAQVEVQQKKDLDGLRQEWGKDYDQRLTRAQYVLKENGSPELNAYLEKSGLGNDANLIRLLANVGTKFYSEGSFKGDASANTMTPALAKAEITRVMGSPGHPYMIKDHPEHAKAVQDMQKLFEMAHGS